jgi:hypothetical protein
VDSRRKYTAALGRLPSAPLRRDAILIEAAGVRDEMTE